MKLNCSLRATLAVLAFTAVYAAFTAKPDTKLESSSKVEVAANKSVAVEKFDDQDYPCADEAEAKSLCEQAHASGMFTDVPCKSVHCKDGEISVSLRSAFLMQKVESRKKAAKKASQLDRVTGDKQEGNICLEVHHNQAHLCGEGLRCNGNLVSHDNFGKCETVGMDSRFECHNDNFLMPDPSSGCEDGDVCGDGGCPMDGGCVRNKCCYNTNSLEIAGYHSSTASGSCWSQYLELSKCPSGLCPRKK